MAEAKEIDWNAIEAEYRAGIRSVRDIAASQGITHGAINKRAKRDEWTRDLSAKIKAKAAELVSKAEVSKQVSKQQADTERSIIAVNAQVQADITLQHRSDIRRHSALRDKLLSECFDQSENSGDYERLAELLDTDDMEKLQAAFRKAMTLPQRVDSFKKLVESTKTLVGLEREAFGISDNSNGDASKPPVDPSKTQNPADAYKAMISR